MAKSKQRKCLTCPAPAKYRGLCESCRQAAKRLIASGDCSEEQLIQKGLILPASRRKGPWTLEAERRLSGVK